MFILKNILLLVFVACAWSCVKSEEKEIQLLPGPAEDKDYFATYTKATALYEVINNFETKFTLQTTILSAEFREALSKRYLRIYNEPQPILNETSQKTAFFMSIYTANEALNNLSDMNLWTIQLQKGNELLKPFKIEKIKEKDRWRPFFKNITPWSVEYLVMFDTPAPSTKDQDLLYVKESKLILSSQDGRVTVNW